MLLDGKEREREGRRGERKRVAFNGDERNEEGGEGLFSSSFV